MKIPAIVVASILLGFGLTGCGGSSTPTPIGAEKTKSSVRVTTYRGHPLYCVVFYGSLAWSGGCDFVRYWEAYNKKGSR